LDRRRAKCPPPLRGLLDRPAGRKQAVSGDPLDDPAHPAEPAHHPVAPPSQRIGIGLARAIHHERDAQHFRPVRREHVDESIHRLERGRGTPKFPDQRGQTLALIDLTGELEEQVRLGSEVQVDRLPRDPRRGRDVLEPDAEIAPLLKERSRRLEDRQPGVGLGA
jgi:hypothetical protein